MIAQPWNEFSFMILTIFKFKNFNLNICFVSESGKSDVVEGKQICEFLGSSISKSFFHNCKWFYLLQTTTTKDYISTCQVVGKPLIESIWTLVYDAIWHRLETVINKSNGDNWYHVDWASPEEEFIDYLSLGNAIWQATRHEIDPKQAIISINLRVNGPTLTLNTWYTTTCRYISEVFLKKLRPIDDKRICEIVNR